MPSLPAKIKVLLLNQIFLSPQVKRWAIIAYKKQFIRVASGVAERLMTEDRPQTPLNLITLTFCVNLRSFTLF